MILILSKHTVAEERNCGDTFGRGDWRENGEAEGHPLDLAGPGMNLLTLPYILMSRVIFR